MAKDECAVDPRAELDAYKKKYSELAGTTERLLSSASLALEIIERQYGRADMDVWQELDKARLSLKHAIETGGERH